VAGHIHRLQGHRSLSCRLVRPSGQSSCLWMLALSG